MKPETRSCLVCTSDLCGFLCLPRKGPRILNILPYYANSPRSQMVIGTHLWSSHWSTFPWSRVPKARHEPGQQIWRCQCNCQVSFFPKGKATGYSLFSPLTLLFLSCVLCLSLGPACWYTGTDSSQPLAGQTRPDGQLGKACVCGSSQLCVKGFIFYQEVSRNSLQKQAGSFQC